MLLPCVVMHSVDTLIADQNMLFLLLGSSFVLFFSILFNLCRFKCKLNLLNN